MQQLEVQYISWGQGCYLRLHCKSTDKLPSLIYNPGTLPNLMNINIYF